MVRTKLKRRNAHSDAKKSVASNTWGGADTLSGTKFKTKLTEEETNEEIKPNPMDPIIPKFRGLTADLKKYSFPKNAVMESEIRAKQCKNGIPFAKLIQDQEIQSGPLFQTLQISKPIEDDNESENQNSTKSTNQRCSHKEPLRFSVCEQPGHSMNSKRTKHDYDGGSPRESFQESANAGSLPPEARKLSKHNLKSQQMEIKGDELANWQASFSKIRDQLNSQLKNILAGNKLDRIEVYQSPTLLASVTEMASHKKDMGIDPGMSHKSTQGSEEAVTMLFQTILKQFSAYRQSNNLFYDPTLHKALQQALMNPNMRAYESNENNEQYGLQNSKDSNNNNRTERQELIFSVETYQNLQDIRLAVLEFHYQSHHFSLWTKARMKAKIIHQLNLIINDQLQKLHNAKKDDKNADKIATSGNSTSHHESQSMHTSGKESSKTPSATMQTSGVVLSDQSNREEEFYRELLIFADRIFGLNVPNSYQSNSMKHTLPREETTNLESTFKVLQVLAHVEMSSNDLEKATKTSRQQQLCHNNELPIEVLALIVHIRNLLEQGHRADHQMFFHCFETKGQLALESKDLLQIFRFMRAYFKIKEDELTQFMFKMGWHLSPSVKEFLMSSK